MSEQTTHNLEEKWPQYDNIHRVLYKLNTDNENIDEFLNTQVNITIKIDGSNLGIHIQKNSYKKWIIAKLRGRNSTIWSIRSTTPINKLPKYGNILLNELPQLMFEFSTAIGDFLKVDDIIVYGEAVAAGKYASWHPFGYLDPINNTFMMLTSDLHNLFKKFSIVESKTIDKVSHFNNTDMINYLKNVKTHVIFPPPTLFNGKLALGINFLTDTMKNSPNDFEGVFVVVEALNNNEYIGFKWKTGFHEEQSKIPQITDLNFKNDESKQAYTKLVEIFMNRPEKDQRVSLARSAEAKTKEMTDKQNEDILKNTIDTAMKRELTKMTSFEHVPKGSRHDIVSSLTKLVIDEIKRQYAGNENSTPIWSHEKIESMTKNLVTVYVMKQPYTSS